jgi:hypothetical protein
MHNPAPPVACHTPHLTGMRGVPRPGGLARPPPPLTCRPPGSAPGVWPPSWRPARPPPWPPGPPSSRCEVTAGGRGGGGGGGQWVAVWTPGKGKARLVGPRGLHTRPLWRRPTSPVITSPPPSPCMVRTAGPLVTPLGDTPGDPSPSLPLGVSPEDVHKVPHVHDREDLSKVLAKLLAIPIICLGRWGSGGCWGRIWHKGAVGWALEGAYSLDGRGLDCSGRAGAGRGPVSRSRARLGRRAPVPRTGAARSPPKDADPVPLRRHAAAPRSRPPRAPAPPVEATRRPCQSSFCVSYVS